MRIIKHTLIVCTVVLCVFVMGIIFFLKSAGEEEMSDLYFMFILMCVVIVYHYKSYAYYNEKRLKRFGKYILLVLSLCALGFNFYVIYESFFYLLDRMINLYGSFIAILQDVLMFLFGLLGVFEILQLRSKIKKVEEKVSLEAEIDDI